MVKDLSELLIDKKKYEGKRIKVTGYYVSLGAQGTDTGFLFGKISKTFGFAQIEDNSNISINFEDANGKPEIFD